MDRLRTTNHSFLNQNDKSECYSPIYSSSLLPSYKTFKATSTPLPSSAFSSPSVGRQRYSIYNGTSPTVNNRYSGSPQQSPRNMSKLEYTLNLNTYADTQSYGLANRIVRYNAEANRKQTDNVVSSPRYTPSRPFPIIRLFKKDPPAITIKPQRVTVHIAQDADPYEGEQRRLILQNIMQEKSKPQNGPETRSVLDALKEISRKRIRSESNNSDSEDRKKAAIENGDEKNKNEQTEINGAKGDYSDIVPCIDPITASLSSTSEKIYSKYVGAKRKAKDLPLEGEQPKKARSHTVETQTTNELIEEPPAPDTVKHKAQEDKDEESKTNEQTSNKENRPVMILDARPLESMRKKKLATLLNTMCGYNTDTGPFNEKTFTSILSPENKPKTAKHVTFNEVVEVRNIPPIESNSMSSASLKPSTSQIIQTTSTQDTSTTFPVSASSQTTSNSIVLNDTPKFTFSTAPSLSPQASTLSTATMSSPQPTISAGISFAPASVGVQNVPSQPGGFKFDLKQTPTTSVTTTTQTNSFFANPVASSESSKATASTTGPTFSTSMPQLTSSLPSSSTPLFQFSSGSNKTQITQPFGTSSTFSVTSNATSANSVDVFKSSAATTNLPDKMSNSTPNFGTSSTIASSLFGTITTTSASSGFGTTSTSSLPFGTSSSAAPFSATNAPASFSTTTTAAPFSVTSSAAPFSFTSTSASPFGSTVKSTPFGTATTNAATTTSSSFGSINKSVSSPFGATSTSAATPFANTSSPFGSSTTSTSSLGSSTLTTSSPFGVPATTTAATSSFFGTSTTSTGSSPFGTNITTTTTSIFGKTSTTTVSSSFGVSTTTTASSARFGEFTSTTSSAPNFGFGTANASSQSSTTTSTVTVFNGGNWTSNNVQTTPSKPPLFGSGTATSNLFGSKTTSASPAFGSTFGSTSTPTFNFGSGGNTGFGSTGQQQQQQTPAPSFGSNTQSLFGSPAPAFGANPQPAASAFGTNPQPAAPAFGSNTQPAAPAFGSNTQSAAPAFGSNSQPAAPAFGSNPQSAAPAFGSNTQPAAPAFGSNPQPAAPAFGSNTSTPAFGASNQSVAPAFGQQSASSGTANQQPSPFGANPQASFGQSSGFGSNPQPTFGAGAQNQTPFGSNPQPAFGSSSQPFGSTATTQPQPFNFGGASAPSTGVFSFGAGGSAAPSFSSPSFNAPGGFGGAPGNMFSIGSGGSTAQKPRAPLRQRRRNL